MNKKVDIQESPPPIQNRRQQQSQEKRQRVLSAANWYFGHRGFRGTSVELIAKRAGVSKGLVFAFFSSKEELYDTVIQQTLEAWTSFAEHQADQYSEEPDRQLESMFRGSFEFVRHSPMLCVLMARRDREIQEQGYGLPHVVQKWRKRLAGVLERGIQTGVFRADIDPHHVARALHGLQHFYLEEMLASGPDSYDLTPMETMLHLLVSGLVHKENGRKAPASKR